MTQHEGPIVRRRVLSRRLRQMREEAGLTLEEAPPRLDFSVSELSRVENAQVMLDVHWVPCVSRWRCADPHPGRSRQPLRAAFCLRVSGDKTGEALAVARQREDATAMVERRGWSVAREFIDDSVSR